MGIWQIVYLGILFFNLGVGLVQHGKKKEGSYNFWTQLLGNAIGVFILYKGGFFG